MSSHFAPECPVPFCVQSEQKLIHDPDSLIRHNQMREYLKTRIGRWNEQDYFDRKDEQKQLFFAINKYLDIDWTDEILYLNATVDDTYTDWPLVIEHKFCLAKPIDVCHLKLNRKDKSKYECVLSSNGKPIPTDKLYDKIIVKNCLKYFQNNEKYFCDFVVNLFKEQVQTKTSLLIIQKCSDLNTLPYSTQIAEQWSQNDIKYTKFMETLQSEFFAIKYDIETFKSLIDCKSKWFRQLKENVPYPLNQNGLLVRMNETMLLQGIRELNEGVFKYHPLDSYVELTDRMLFVGALHQVNRKDALIERIKSDKRKSVYNPKMDIEIDNEIRCLHMEITPDIKDLIKTNTFKRI
jgi:hypothetical protein